MISYYVSLFIFEDAVVGAKYIVFFIWRSQVHRRLKVYRIIDKAQSSRTKRLLCHTVLRLALTSHIFKERLSGTSEERGYQFFGHFKSGVELFKNADDREPSIHVRLCLCGQQINTFRNFDALRIPVPSNCNQIAVIAINYNEPARWCWRFRSVSTT